MALYGFGPSQRRYISRPVVPSHFRTAMRSREYHIYVTASANPTVYNDVFGIPPIYIASIVSIPNVLPRVSQGAISSHLDDSFVVRFVIQYLPCVVFEFVVTNDAQLAQPHPFPSWRVRCSEFNGSNQSLSRNKIFLIANFLYLVGGWGGWRGWVVLVVGGCYPYIPRCAFLVLFF